MRRYYKPFPPGLGHIKIPMTNRRSATAALGLYSACRPMAVWMQRLALATTRIFGARVLPGRAVLWTPPMDSESWRELCAEWRQNIGSFDEFAIGERSQRLRSGFAVLLFLRGRPCAFVKVGFHGLRALEHEYAAIQQVWKARPQEFSIPEPLGSGRVGDWHYIATAALPSPCHSVPRNPPLEAILSEIGAAMSALPRDPTTPRHWRPMHGDFTPWNLRQLPDGKLVLFDWEDASWGPPDADDVLYRASFAALGNPHPGVHQADEAVRYWHARVSGREQGGKRDREVNRSLCRILERMHDRARPANQHAGAAGVL